ncbi:MAG: heat-inducible transcriptional repressor HrcA [Kineosporiaceae bacterium]
MTDDRRLAVLRAIVEDYVRTREPVGSKALVERHSLGVSPATIRNDMAALEEEGYIAQPHTSAGRIPTDLGYRMFVDRLARVKPLSSAEKRAIHSLLDAAVDLDDVLDRTVRLLAQFTHQVAVVQYPSLSRSTVRHIELVPLAADRILVVLITDTGRVEQRVAEVGAELTDQVLADLRARLNTVAVGAPLTSVGTHAEEVAATFPADDRAAVGRVVDALATTADSEREERIVLAGTANLARSGPDFARSIEPVLEALEEQVVLLRLLTDMAADTGDVGVRIGHETAYEGLAETSLVASGYGAPGQVVARIGVLGPTRMDYPTTIGTVRAVARYLSRILAS